MLTKTVLFEARTKGFWNYRVPGIVCSRNWDGNDVLSRRSLDVGSTWEAPRFDDVLPEPICFGSILKLKGSSGIFVKLQGFSIN